MWFIQGILLGVSAIVMIIVISAINRKKLPDKPQNDSEWEIDNDSLYKDLQRFISNKREKIYAVLNVQNAMNLLKKDISEEGFAILTDKACYFVGKVYQKKWIFAFKSNIQHRIVASEMKGVKVGSLSRIGMIIPAIISTILFVCEIKWFVYTYKYSDMLSRMYNDDAYGWMLIVSIGIAFILLFLSVYCLVQAFILRRTNICIEFTSLTIAFLVSSLGAQEIKDFYKAVSKVQEINMNPIPVVNVASESSELHPNNKIQQLSELSKLYERNIVSEDEFNKLKAEIINN